VELEVVVQNIKRMRAVRGISQQSLSDLSGVSLPAIKKLEGLKNEPRVDTLRAISQALDVRLQELFRPVRQLKTVRFRSKKRLRNRENILAQTATWLDNFNFIEKILQDHISFKFESDLDSGMDPVELACFCREKLQLRPTEPIHNICGLLEGAGVKVLSMNYASNDFFGLCVGRDDGGPAVVVNVWEKISAERRIFSAVHEFGHVLLHRSSLDIEKTAESDQEEVEANQFAGYFLLPDEGFLKEWDAAAGLHAVERVFKVKRMFGVSYKTVLRRLVDLEKVDSSVWRKFNLAYQQRYNRKLGFKEEPEGLSGQEPFGLKPIDFHESRFSRLVLRAVEENKISVSKGAEILKISIGEVQQLLTGLEVAI